jgi:signal transduction histidine kinase
MDVVALLDTIKPVWVEQVVTDLARGETVRANFLAPVNQFFDLMRQAIRAGDPAWLGPILDEWANSLTQSDLEDSSVGLADVLNHILLATHQVAARELDSAAGMILLGAVIPIYTYAINYSAAKEAQLQINHIAAELNQVRNTLERLDRSKSDFIAVAAHELKTPLTLIEGYAAMLRDKFPADDNDSSAVLFLKGMDNGIRRLQEIVNDMIDVSLIDNKLLNLNFQPVWINQLLNIAHRELTKFIQERTLSFEIVEFNGCRQMTYGDPERLFQALRNILTNAIKYTPDGGKITVDGRQLPGFIEITIADTGIGIDEAHHEQIFYKFGRLGDVQLHSSGKTKFKGGGPGLGLPITKGLIEAHGGTIWVESPGYNEVNCPGSTFHVLLPILDRPPSEKISRLFTKTDYNPEGSS